MALSALVHGGLALMAPPFRPAMELDLSADVPLVLEIQLEQAPAVAGDDGAGSVPGPGAVEAVLTDLAADAASETESRGEGDPKKRAEAAAESPQAPRSRADGVEGRPPVESAPATAEAPAQTEAPAKADPEERAHTVEDPPSAVPPPPSPAADAEGRHPKKESAPPVARTSEKKPKAKEAQSPPKPKPAKTPPRTKRDSKRASRPAAPAADKPKVRGTGKTAKSSGGDTGSAKVPSSAGAAKGRATGKISNPSRGAAGSGRAGGGTGAALLPAPKPRYSPSPDYPEQARWEERTGAATVSFRIRPNGSVYDVGLITSSGHRDLDQAAMRAIARWLFKVDSSVSSKNRYRYRFRFRLE